MKLYKQFVTSLAHAPAPLFLNIIQQNSMNIQYPISECPSLNQMNCRSVELTFTQPLDQLAQQTTAMIVNLQDKPLTKCYLIPKELPEPKYDGIMLGGTFDYLHIGHQLLLLTAILQARFRIGIGLTGDEMLSKKKNKQIIQSYQVRERQLLNYIRKIKPDIQVQVVQLFDIYGPAGFREDVQALVVSEETIIGGEEINKVRKQKGLEPLDIIVCPLASQNKNLQAKLSSTHARQYILNKNKMSLEQMIWYKNKWVDFNNKLRHYFKFEQDELYTEIWWNRILLQYSQYWRYYHTNSHIYQMLTQFEKDPAVAKLEPLQLFSVEAGIWFHDVEYVPLANNNEELSAQTCTQFLKGLTKQQQNQELALLISTSSKSILETKYHKSQNLAAKVLIDLDMSILDANPQIYDQYAYSIKLEYGPVAGALYNQKRKQFLKSIKPGEVFYFRKQTHLIENITREITNLEQQSKSQI